MWSQPPDQPGQATGPPSGSTRPRPRPRRARMELPGGIRPPRGPRGRVPCHGHPKDRTAEACEHERLVSSHGAPGSWEPAGLPPRGAWSPSSPACHRPAGLIQGTLASLLNGNKSGGGPGGTGCPAGRAALAESRYMTAKTRPRCPGRVLIANIQTRKHGHATAPKGVCFQQFLPPPTPGCWR